jgi:transcriptional regulator with XRE-family HTH domain
MTELRLLFAGNLKRLLREEKSIAHVCRALEINRQQFNRYLSGETLPGNANLKKIADYFKVSESSLIAATQETNEAADVRAAEPLFEQLAEAFAGGTPGLRGGLYSYYLPFATDGTKCLRGLVIVRSEAGKTRFDAALSLRPANTGWRAGSLIRYSGLVRERGGKMLLLGTDISEPADIFMVNVEPFYSSRGRLFTGVSTSARADGINARRVAIEFAADQSRLCKLVRTCGLWDLGSAEIDPWVRAAISPDRETDPLVLLPRDMTAVIGA